MLDADGVSNAFSAQVKAIICKIYSDWTYFQGAKCQNRFCFPSAKGTALEGKNLLLKANSFLIE